jgi:nucleoid DNA-binding protein
MKDKGPTIRKHDLVKMTARITGTKLMDTEKIVNALFASLRHYMMNAGAPARIMIQEFGSFRIAIKPGYRTTVFTGRVKSGENGPRVMHEFPPAKRIRFYPGAILQEHLDTALARAAEEAERNRIRPLAEQLAEPDAEPAGEVSWDPPEEKAPLNHLVDEEVRAAMEQTGETIQVQMEPEPESAPAERETDYF